ncbi:MAG: response regulator [Bacteroidota bacterium]
MKRKAILCVDDEKPILESLKEQITNNLDSQYLVEIAESSDEAWEVIEELVEDGIGILIIVSDWLMPGMKGDEFLIKVHEQYPQIYTVLLTGQADEKAVLNAKENANLFKYLTKPWKEEQLIDIIKTAYDETSNTMRG